MAVARQVGIVNERAQVVYGADLDAMEEAEFEALLRDESELIVARLPRRRPSCASSTRSARPATRSR